MDRLIEKYRQIIKNEVVGWTKFDNLTVSSEIMSICPPYKSFSCFVPHATEYRYKAFPDRIGK